MIKQISDKKWKIDLWLFSITFLIYFIFFKDIFLNLNDVLSSVTGDALKNYFTFCFHINNDADLLHFNGMNYPYGEHVVYTDCQPLLTFILRSLPFTAEYLIGILHFLLFFSFIISPLILFRILIRSGLENFSAFFIAIAITLLAPQFQKINGGHHGLAYGCVIPLSILLTLNLMGDLSTKNIFLLTAYNFLLFFIHPYLGFSASIFSLVALSLNSFAKTQVPVLRKFFYSLTTGLVPLFLFKSFMFLTDTHHDRTTEPQGKNTLIENLGSLTVPDYGPFQSVLQYIFPDRTEHLEGHSYLGFFLILLTFVVLIILPFKLKRLRFDFQTGSLLFASILLLFISFGWHNDLAGMLHLKSEGLNQFRATSRFAWSFYYMLPIFLVSLFRYHDLKIPQIKIFRFLAVTFFVFNLVEASFYFQKDRENFWKFENVFRKKHLSGFYKNILEGLSANKIQAIMPLPVFHIGSEVYARTGGDNSMIPAMILSYHSRIPIFGASLSRTSISETENEIELLNVYKKKRAIFSRLNSDPFLVINTKDQLMPDEERLLQAFKPQWNNEVLEIGMMPLQYFITRKRDEKIIELDGSLIIDSNLVFIESENRKPFLTSSMNDYEKIFVLDSNIIVSGKYTVSLHYYPMNEKKESVNFIITKADQKEFIWAYNESLRLTSGFYDNFRVFEMNVDLSKHTKYEFILKGFANKPYKIGNFLIRPSGTTVLKLNGKDTIINNFPD